MNRRGFLKLLTSAAITAAVITHVPTSWIPEEAHSKAAIEFLTRIWRKNSTNSSNYPRRIWVSQAVYNMYGSELTPVQRWTMLEDFNVSKKPNLFFKNSIVTADDNLTGWQYHVEQEQPK